MNNNIPVSIVGYSNTIPFRFGISYFGLESKLAITYDIPSECARKLKTGEAKIGLIPVALLKTNPNLIPINNLGIAANGMVDSVKLYTEVPLNRIKTILLDYQSKTSVELVKILSEKFWKINPDFIDAGQGFESEMSGETAIVVIGDRTFSLNGKSPFEFDLANEWKKFTGLPFVFARWVKSNDWSDDSIIHELNSALQYGVEHISDAIESMSQGHPFKDNLPEYLLNRIRYTIDNQEIKAIERFLSFMQV